MKLEGKKINFLGDSITEGWGASSVENTYWNILKRSCGLSEARGYGIGGTRFARQIVPSADSRVDLDFCMRYKEMNDDADIVVVFGGTNDFDHGDAPIGTFSDRAPDTFYGACHTLFCGLINKYPSATIVVMTPLHRTREMGDNIGHFDAPLVEYVRIIKEVAEHYSLPVLDLWACSGIQPNIEVIREKYCPDGLHPCDAGHKIIASRLEGFLRGL